MKMNKTLKKRVIEITLIVVLSCIIFLACNRNPSKSGIMISKAGEQESADGAETAPNYNPDERMYSDASGSADESVNEDANKSADMNEDGNAEVSTPDSTVCVYVCGAVKNPGLYTLPNESRAMAAVEAAGGFREEAADDVINLAQTLEDGSMIRIPTKDEAAGNAFSEGEYISTPNAGITGTSGDSGSADKRVNINTADASGLCEIPGIGEVRAKAILDYRNECGNFSRVEDLMNVPGIKEGTFEKIKDYVKIN